MNVQVRLESFTISDQDRRAIRFCNDGRKTMCTREEAKEFIDAAVQRALRDVRYRWHGPQVSEAALNGADPDALAAHDRPGLHVAG